MIQPGRIDERIMKNYFASRKILILSALLFIGGAVYFFYPKGWEVFTPASNEQKLTRLFRRMGLIPYTDITGPDEIQFIDFSGRPVRLTDFKGKIVLLNFWATWCPDCVKEMPAMQKLHLKLKGKDFVMAAVNMKESRVRVQAFYKKHQLTFAGFLDLSGKAASRMAVRAIPTTFILDRDGAVLAMGAGSRPWDSRQAVELIEYLIDR